MIVKPRLKCEGCIRPVARRLALFKVNDEYECYAESYIKCFWGLCDLHESLDNLIPNTINQVITEQPKSEKMPFKNRNMLQNVTVKN